MKIKYYILLILLATIIAVGFWLVKMFTVGQEIDSFNGVAVYYNGGYSNVSGRNVTDDGYNLGLKYQCVEFVKRYYYEHLNHKMPDSYGHAKDFYDKKVADGKRNRRRNLTQYSNPSKSKPMVSDLIVFEAGKYGHVAIVAKVKDDKIEIVQQNSKWFWNSRRTLKLSFREGKWMIENPLIVGWLRKE